MPDKIIGRAKEQMTLNHILNSNKAEFLALYGRRRVGKTFLVRNYFSESSPCIFFHTTGIQDGTSKQQLNQFGKQLGAAFYNGASIAKLQNWFDAFEELNKAILQVPHKKKIILFFDEFPWMATKRSGLLSALEYYWNRYWNFDARIKLVICGSSASWVIEKIINNKGGLYNRVTRTMRLSPFTLRETESFLVSKGIKLNQRHVLELYMALGGIPHHLDLIRRGQSAQQAIEALCFQKNGDLVHEFDRLFASLFKESAIYSDLIRIIAHYRYGISKSHLINESKLSRGGRAALRLKDLEEAGFIEEFLPHGNKEKGTYYKIVDEYILFYLQWIEPLLNSIKKQDQHTGYWLSRVRTPNWKSWSGYAFEAVCSKHISQIRKALSIDPGAEAGSWRYIPRNDEEKRGAQIDLLFDRPDDAITICEIKQTDTPFMIFK